MDATRYTPEDAVAALRAELARTGRSQTWLAAQVGESKHWVSRRLAGQVDLGVGDMLRIAEALDVEPASLLRRPA